MSKRPAEPKPGEPITLVQTRTGEYRYRTVLDYAPAGQRRQQRRATFGTLTEARAHVASIRGDRERGALPLGVATFNQVADEWLADRKRKVRPTTLRGYSDTLDHARRAFGTKPIAKVTRADVERLAQQLEDDGLSARTASLCLGRVRAVFKRALAEGRTVRNVADGVSGHAGQPKARVPLTVDEARSIAAEAGQHRLHAAWLLTLCGMRRSEVLGLMWGDVELEEGTVTVRRSRTQVGKHEHVDETKTKRGTRTLPMPDDVTAALRAWRAKVAGELGVQVVGAERYLFVNEGGTPLRPEWYSDEWVRLLASAGVRRNIMYAARHYSITTMRASGLPDRLVAAWHGHDEVTMRRTYDHPDMDTEGLAEVGRALAVLRAEAVSE